MPPPTFQDGLTPLQEDPLSLDNRYRCSQKPRSILPCLHVLLSCNAHGPPSYWSENLSEIYLRKQGDVHPQIENGSCS